MYNILDFYVTQLSTEKVLYENVCWFGWDIWVIQQWQPTSYLCDITQIYNSGSHNLVCWGKPCMQAAQTEAQNWMAGWKTATAMNQKGLGSAEKVRKGEEKAKNW